MAKRRQYRNPPLVEVFSEFFFQPDQEKEWDSFLVPKFYHKIKAQFPERKRLSSVAIQLQLATGGGAPKVQPVGPPTPRHRFSSADGKTLVQIGENLLVVNQLPPYYGWEQYEPVVSECFRHYTQFWKPANVGRAGVHYIDKVDIPRLEFNLEDYFNLFPVLPEFPNTPATNITLSYEVQGARDEDVVVTTLQQHPSANPAGASFLIQWDYVATAGLPVEVQQVQTWLQAAHDFLSELFLSTLTEECRKLFD